jgi:hypothetical protein
MDIAHRFHRLAKHFGIVYRETGYDRLADHITRLCGDEVELDDVELLLVELQRSGHLEGKEATLLHATYLREIGLSAAHKS